MRLLSGRIAEALGDTIVAPVIAHVPEGGIDPPSGHMGFAGSMTVPPELFAANVEWAARSLRLSGFETIVLLGDSGWNQAPLREVARKLRAEWGGVILFADTYYTSNVAFAIMLEKEGFAEPGRHAGLVDTAVMLALDPSAVREPGEATAALGARGVELFVRRTVKQIRVFRGE